MILADVDGVSVVRTVVFVIAGWLHADLSAGIDHVLAKVASR